MTECIRFSGVDHDVIVDLQSEHPGGGEFDCYSFKEHLPVESFKSEDGYSLSEVRSRAGEHMFSCEECIQDEKVMVNNGY